MPSVLILSIVSIICVNGVVIVNESWPNSSITRTNWVPETNGGGTFEPYGGGMALLVPRGNSIQITRRIALNRNYKNIQVSFTAKHRTSDGGSHFYWCCDDTTTSCSSWGTLGKIPWGTRWIGYIDRALGNCDGAEYLYMRFRCVSVSFFTALNVGQLTLYGEDSTEEPTPSPTVETPATSQGTESPTSAPTKEPCDDETPYNLMFIIDESGSIGQANYELSIDFINDLIRYDVNSIAKLAVLSYSAGNDIVYRFNNEQNDGRVSILRELENEKNDYNKGATRTFDALLEGLEQFKNNTNETENNLVLLFTDGAPTDPVCGYNNNQYDLIREYKKQNIRVIIVGITANFTKTKLDCIAYNGDIFEIEDFGSQQFERIENELRNILCPNPQCDVGVISSAVAALNNDKYDKYDGSYDEFKILSVLLVIINITFIICYGLYKYSDLNNQPRGYEKPKYQKEYLDEQQVENREENINLN